jgi:hypothetical protein
MREHRLGQRSGAGPFRVHSSLGRLLLLGLAGGARDAGAPLPCSRFPAAEHPRSRLMHKAHARTTGIGIIIVMHPIGRGIELAPSDGEPLPARPGSGACRACSRRAPRGLASRRPQPLASATGFWRHLLHPLVARRDQRPGCGRGGSAGGRGGLGYGGGFGLVAISLPFHPLRTALPQPWTNLRASNEFSRSLAQRGPLGFGRPPLRSVVVVIGLAELCDLDHGVGEFDDHPQ